MTRHLSPRTALWLFIAMIIFLFAQGTWWVVFMAQLVDEKVDLAEELGGSPEFVERIHQEEISRQVMVGLEGVVFLILLLVGFWLIYRSLVRLQELKFHQENFLMAITHELKTPLASLTLYLDSLESDRIPDGDKERILPKMRHDIYRLHTLVDNALEAGRFQRTGYRLQRTDFNLSTLLQERIEALHDIPWERQCEVTQKIEPNLIFHGDRAALGRAIDAVLDNARKYNDQDTIRVGVTAHADGNEITIAISDNGVGLERKHLAAVFDRFYRAGSELTRRTDGTGLGLYLCREIIRAHGGSIRAASAGSGLGCQFTISLRRGQP